MLHLVRRAMVDKAAGEPRDQADRPVGGTQQQRPGIRGDRAAIERRHHGPAFDACKLEPIRDTVCRHRTPALEFW